MMQYNAQQHGVQYFNQHSEQGGMQHQSQGVGLHGVDGARDDGCGGYPTTATGVVVAHPLDDFAAVANSTASPCTCSPTSSPDSTRKGISSAVQSSANNPLQSSATTTPMLGIESSTTTTPMARIHSHKLVDTDAAGPSDEMMQGPVNDGEAAVGGDDGQHDTAAHMLAVRMVFLNGVFEWCF